MATINELARGSVEAKNTKGWGQAELFWEARTSDSAAKSDHFTKWNEGTLWIGNPSLSKTDEKAIPIAGARINNGLVYRGEIRSNVTTIVDPTFIHAHVGDFYIFKEDAGGSEFKEMDFRAGDILLITDIGENNVDLVSGTIADPGKIKYERINNSGGYADDVYFKDGDKTFVNFESNNVEDALLELQIKKLEYKGEIGAVKDIPAEKIIGSLYLVTSNGIPFLNGEETITASKGDFVFWTADTLADRKKGNFYWHLIPSGYTSADEIDYYSEMPGELATFISGLNSFTKSHKDKFKESSGNVKQALDFLMTNKAQLDDQGKVPLSQLHSTILGTVQYRGIWNPIGGAGVAGVDFVVDPDTGTTTILHQNPLPGSAIFDQGDTENRNDDEKVNPGDYYIVEVPKDATNVLYSLSSNGKSNSVLELNTGDWIIYNDSNALDEKQDDGVKAEAYGWSKIDNSERLQCIKFKVNGYIDDNGTHDLPEKLISKVGAPTISANGGIALVQTSENGVCISGKNLVSRNPDDVGEPYRHIRYSSDGETLESAFVVDEPDVNHSDEKTSTTKNITRYYSNVEIGNVNQDRTMSVHGSMKILPHYCLRDGSGDFSLEEKSYADFVVNVGNEKKTLHLSAPDGTVRSTFQEDSLEETNCHIILPRRTSTVVGKLAGVEFKSGRVTKSTVDGFIESTSIEEIKVGEGTEDNFNDKVLFHSEVTTPKANTFEVTFGSYKDDQTPVTNDDFSNGSLASKFLTRLRANRVQGDTINVFLPATSGTLLTQENLLDLVPSKGEESYLSMWSERKFLDHADVKFPTLTISPIQMVKNALRTKLSIETDDLFTKDKRTGFVKSLVGEVDTSEDATAANWKPSSEKDGDVVVHTDLIAGSFDQNGVLEEGRSILATKSIGVSGKDSTGVFAPARSHFSDARQYINPFTGMATPVADVVVDMPGESGVLLTSNSVIDGGFYKEK